MDFAVDEQIARISRRIRQWRGEEDLTLQQLAERGGLATSTVQKVETGQMMPSLAVLLKLAHGLGRHVAELLDDEDPCVDVFHSKACDRETLRAGGRLVAERLSGNIARSALETWQVTLEPGASSGSDPIRFDGEQIVICAEGRVTFRLDHVDYELHAGDSLHFRANIPHSWVNYGDTTARFSLTGTMPVLFRSLMQTQIASASRESSAPTATRISLVS
jgi:transcriptional regulator with XRE-family HTH domain